MSHKKRIRVPNSVRGAANRRDYRLGYRIILNAGSRLEARFHLGRTRLNDSAFYRGMSDALQIRKMRGEFLSVEA